MEIDVMEYPSLNRITNALQKSQVTHQACDIISKPEVCIVLIHEGKLVSGAARFIQHNYEQGCRVVMYREQRPYKHKNSIVEKYLNCSHARNRAKASALKLDCDWFMFLDADVAPPLNAIDHFLMMKEEVCGGWYPIKNTNRWVAARWVADNTLYTMREPEKRIITHSHMTPLGCCLMHRSVVESTEFRHGTDSSFQEYGSDRWGMLGECLEFGNQLHALGTTTFMAPGVVCQHLDFGTHSIEIEPSKDFRAARDKQKTTVNT